LTIKGVLYSNWHAFCSLSLSNLRIFSLIDIVEPFLPIGFQNTLQIVSVVRALQDIVINRKKYSENMKKIFRKIQKGTTKMFRRIKALGGMENEAEMCSLTL
jgi:Skp family chaperone for outer membrane proteins